MQSTTARNRVPDATSVSLDASARGGSRHPARPMPVSSSISWTPIASAAASDTYGATFPIFITQQAVAAVLDHRSSTDGSTSLGFLTGDIVQCPKAGTPYIVIDSVIPSPTPVAEGDRGAALLRGRMLAGDEARKTGRVLLGWYHNELLPDGELSPDDADLHVALFDQPWHVVLALGPGDEGQEEGEKKLAAGFFRWSSDAGWSKRYLPFFELLDGPSLLPDGRKVTAVKWQTYRTADVVQPSDHASLQQAMPPEVPRQPVVLFPDDFGARAPWPRERIARYTVYGIGGVLAALGFVSLYHLFVPASPPDGPARAERAAAVSPRERLDPLADTVAIAVAAFDLRARLFEKRQMTCEDLSRGLVQVEERWTAYSRARKAGPYALDSARDARDRKLYGDVDAVERRFERSSCPRP